MRGAAVLAVAVLLVPAIGRTAAATLETFRRELADGKAVGYVWDPASRESWAENLSWLEPGADFASAEADAAVLAYVANQTPYEELFPVPVTARDAHGRGLVLTGILLGLDRDARQAGAGDGFLEGLRDLVAFYHRDFPYPDAWLAAEGAQDRALVDQKADVFVFLLSAFTRLDLSKTFARLRWPVSGRTKSALVGLAGKGWDPKVRDQLLTLLLKERAAAGGSSAAKGGPAAPGASTKGRAAAAVRAPSAGAAPARARSSDPPEYAGIAQVPTTPRSIERGLVTPSAPSSASSPAPQGGGLFGRVLGGLANLGKKAVNTVVGAAKKVIDGGKTVVTSVVDAGKWAWSTSKSVVSGLVMISPFQPKNRPKLSCKFLVFDCQTQWRNGAEPEPGNRRNCKFLLFGCETGLDPNAKYVTIDGELFVEGPGDGIDIHPNDISQGAIGDCYFMSSIAAVAQQDPNLIRRMIKKKADGTYDVTFYRWSGSNASAVTVNVDNRFPTRDSMVLYAKGGDQRELWPMVLEKAYAKFHDNSYVEIGYGGWPDQAMQELSGKPSSSSSAGGASLKALAAAHAQGAGIVIATLGAGQTKNDPLYQSGRLINGHAFWVKEINLKNGTVTLVNPWGWGNDADLVVLTEAQFHHSLQSVYVNPLH